MDFAKVDSYVGKTPFITKSNARDRDRLHGSCPGRTRNRFDHLRGFAQSQHLIPSAEEQLELTDLAKFAKSSGWKRGIRGFCTTKSQEILLTIAAMRFTTFASLMAQRTGRSMALLSFWSTSY